MLENSVPPFPPRTHTKVNKKYTFFKTCIKMFNCAFCKGLKKKTFLFVRYFAFKRKHRIFNE